MKIQREQIITTALLLLDRHGLEGVTVRKVAAELHVQPGALYWHVQSKQELLDEMANVLLSHSFAQFEGRAPEQDWAVWLQELCLRLRQAMLAHREGARVVAGAGFGRAIMLAQLVDSTLRTLLDAGFPLRLAFLAWSTTSSYVYGFVIEEQAAPNAETLNKADTSTESLIAAAHREIQTHQYTPDMDFLAGLQMILAGLKQTLEAPSP